MKKVKKAVDKFKKTPALEEQEKAVKEEKKEAPEKETPKKEEVREPVEAEVWVGETEGFKKPSLTTRRMVHTYKSYKELIEKYKKQNPVKYKTKRVVLEAKLRRLK